MSCRSRRIRSRRSPPPSARSANAIARSASTSPSDGIRRSIARSARSGSRGCSRGRGWRSTWPTCRRPRSPTASAWSRSPTSGGPPRSRTWSRWGSVPSREIAERFYAASSYPVEGGRSFVAWDDDEPVGMAAAYLHDGAIGIFGVAVVPAARRRGIASTLSVIAARAFPADLAWLHTDDAASTVGLRAPRVPRGREVGGLDPQGGVASRASGRVRRPTYTRPRDRARRGASGALYPKSASAGLNPRPRPGWSGAALGTER